ncbi:MAG: leucine-rich repeat domain-containing protein [Clostridia bacterium]|nr:leucine-rich repeat domain-containing protein [Clostridia bacterium]
MEFKKLVQNIMKSKNLKTELLKKKSFEEVYEFFRDNGYIGNKEKLKENLFGKTESTYNMSDKELEQISGGASGHKALAACASLMMMFGTTMIIPNNSVAYAETAPSVSVAVTHDSMKNQKSADQKNKVIFTKNDVDRNATCITVPEGVTEIESGAFWYCKNLKEVKLPSTLQSIGSSAFGGCELLEKINIPKGIEKINFLTFGDCYQLKEITLPDTIKEIGPSAFASCIGLSHIELPSSLEKIGERAFANNLELKSINIPDKVQEIPKSAFDCCMHLEKVKLPSSLEKIGECAFWFCTELKEIKLPKTLKEIGVSAFDSCWNLSKISIPNSVKLVDKNAFNNTKYEKSLKYKLQKGLTKFKNIFRKKTNQTIIKD